MIMKTAVIRELTTKEIEERVDAEKTVLTKLRMNHAVSPLDNPMKIKTTRKVIAKMRTELRKRQINEIK
jgi:large subunit ribosomal protein L29